MTTDWNSWRNVELGSPGHSPTLSENGSGRRLSRGDSNSSMEIRRASPTLGSGENILLEDLSTPLQDTTASENKKSPVPKPMLRYQKRSAWLLAIYVPLLVVPWALTCLMAVRPFNLPSYINQRGQYSPEEFAISLGALVAVRFLNSVGSLVTVPIVSSLLAHAAIIYTQRHDLGQSLSIPQNLALADRGWSDITIVYSSIFRKKSNRFQRSGFLLWASAMMLLSSIQQPIQQLLVSTKSFLTVTCNDNPVFIENQSSSCEKTGIGHVSIGYDPEPADLELMPQKIVVQEVMAKTLTAFDQSLQLHLWPENYTCADDVMAADRNTFFWYWNRRCDQPESYFVSSLPNGTTTGVLREHAMRLNSSVQCSNIPRSEFPPKCPGSRPFTVNFTLGPASNPTTSPPALDIRICLPGDYRLTPWTLSRDRQDITENLYLDIYLVSPELYENTATIGSPTNYTLQCTANSTRGYFELGNYQNGYQPGPLLEKWPEVLDMMANFNDYLGPLGSDARPGKINRYSSIDDNSRFSPLPDPFNEGKPFRTPGPLMTSAISLFGNESFFNTAATSAAPANADFTNATSSTVLGQICRKNRIPFTRLSIDFDNKLQSWCYAEQEEDYMEHRLDYEEHRLISFIYQWFATFAAASQEALSASLFFANEAYLTQTADATALTKTARAIYTSPGFTMVKPEKALASTIAISILMFLELLALSYLTWYIYSAPTWTTSLDALAVARIGASLPAGTLPALGPVSRKDMEGLRKVDGLVGVEEEGEGEGEGTPHEGGNRTLGLGAAGLIPRRWKKGKKGIRSGDSSVEQEGQGRLKEIANE